jgi:methyltransferase (TIGR00027 family)
MIDGSPSRTALMVAAMRADHALNAPEPKILDDTLAMSLAGFDTPDKLAGHMEAIIAGFTALSDNETAHLFTNRIAHSVCMRSRLVEGELQAGREHGLQQLVVLGAGLDSTAYRLPELTKGLQVFEVDHPATQKWKRERLSDIGVDMPDNLRFVSFDFEHQTLADALNRGGVDQNAMTLFSWLGVHPYLTAEAVTSTLAVLGTFPKGSELVMDFVLPDYSRQNEVISDGLDQLEKVVAKMGEPFLSLNTEEELEAMLKTAGFSRVDFQIVRELNERFLGGRHELNALPPETMSLLSAII